MKALFMVLCMSPAATTSPSFNDNDETELFTTVLQANKRKKELEKEGITNGWSYRIMQLIPTELTCEVDNG